MSLSAKENRENPLQAVSAVLAEKKAALIAALKTGAAPDFMSRHAGFLDDYFRDGFEKSNVGFRMNISKNPYALIAQGGYGRGEQCTHSDVDLLILFEKSVPREAEDLVQEIVYPLWDLGIEVGHATRSIKECISLAGEDFEVLTSLLDARFICGISPLYSGLMEKLHSRIIRRQPGKIINWLIDTNRARHHNFGDSAYLLEPNLKEGRGGLRDYHTMRWIARIQSDMKDRRGLEYFGFLSHDEYEELNQSLSFIWQVRNHLHLLTGRKCDQLHLEYQTKLADAMNFKGENGHLPVEKLLGELHGRMEFLKQQHLMFLYDQEQQKKLKRKNSVLKCTEIPGLKFNRGMLNFTSPEAVLSDPSLLIRIFLESTVKKAPLNAEAKRLVKEFAYLVDRHFRSSPENTRIFEQILLKPTSNFNVLNQMLHTGFLVRYIPEFKSVVDRIQFDQYHLYPVVRHLLTAVRTLKTFGARLGREMDPLLFDTYKEIKSKRLVLWATLLHDIGKAEPRPGHSERGADMAKEMLREKGLKPQEIDTVCFLVKEHLLLMKTATRRDINDEETCLAVARRIKKIDRLKMLYLLSVADAMATGPKAWNDWTSSLIRSLYLKILKIMEVGELATHWAVKSTEKKRLALMAAAGDLESKSFFEDLYRQMSPRYLLYMPQRDIFRHLDLYRRLEEKAFVWEVEKNNDPNRRTVTICAKDRPGLISKIAGVFTLNNIDILDVQIFTWRNDIALDIFQVTPPPDLLLEDEKWRRAENELAAALGGELALTPELARKQEGFRSIEGHTKDRPQKVVIDNDSSSFYTIIEVYAWDFPGLLYQVTDALFNCRLNVWVAKIATQVDQVVDVFYVRDLEGEKADTPDQEAAIKSAIEAVLNRQAPSDRSGTP